VEGACGPFLNRKFTAGEGLALLTGSILRSRPATGEGSRISHTTFAATEDRNRKSAKQQADKPSRSEANRRLIEFAPAAESKDRSGKEFFGYLRVADLGPNVYNIVDGYTRHRMWPMRTNIEIDDVLMRQAQKASGHATKKQTVEEALRLMIRLRRQHEVDAAFGRYRWRGNLPRSRTGRGTR
jgi:Arc/MetJ family transcription regulator